LLRLHAAVNKNRKEQALPLHHERAKALQQQQSVNPAGEQTEWRTFQLFDFPSFRTENI